MEVACIKSFIAYALGPNVKKLFKPEFANFRNRLVPGRIFQTSLPETKKEKPAVPGTDISLLRKFVNYGRKKFYKIGPRAS
jgi:hypothetical protein